MHNVNEQDKHTTVKDWVHAHTDALFAWAHQKVADRAIAEDLVQDTFMAACLSFETYRKESSPRTWLFQILHHKIADHFRKKLRNPVVMESSLRTDRAEGIMQQFFIADGAWQPSRAPQHEALYDTHLLDDPAFSAELQKCMEKLPSGWNVTIQLKFLQEKNSKDICQDLNISTTNYWQILHRAKLQLRQCLNLHWFKQ